MCVPMTTGADTARRPRPEVLEKAVMVGDVVPHSTAGAVALHAVVISKRSGDVDPGKRFADVLPGIVRQEVVDVTHAAEFGEHEAIHPVVSVTSKAAFVSEHLGARMDGRKPHAVRIVRVRDVEVHRMAAAAEDLLLHRIEAFHVSDEGSHDRQHTETEHEETFRPQVERRTVHQVQHQDDCSDDGASESDPRQWRSMHGVPSSRLSKRPSRINHAPRPGTNASSKFLSIVRRGGLVLAAVFAFSCVPATAAYAQPHRIGAERWGQANPNYGLIILEGSTRKYPYIDAEALVWGAVGTSEPGFDNAAQFEALVVTLRLRDPRGISDTRLGRFILATGSVRAMHIDGGHVTLRARSKTHFEVFGGVPVDGNVDGRQHDWMVGGRLSQGLGKRGVIGASYYNRFNTGQRSDEEVGGDFALRVAHWLDMAAKVSWELVNPGLVEVLGTISAETKSRAIRGEVYVTKRSATRLLQATSLFTVIGDPETLATGANLLWRAAPRLDLWVNGALRDAQEKYGWSGYVRGVLRTDDEGKGSILGEVRRQSVSVSQWTGLRVAAVIPLYEDFDTTVGLMPEFEIVFPDDPEPDQGSVWPWGRLALRWEPTRSWAIAAACEASANQVQRYEVRGLARVSYQAEWPKR